jgi:SAM-dependent methyltransferase
VGVNADGDRYLDPLAYLIALEGVALLRGFGGQFGQEFQAARLAEARELLASAHLGSGWTLPSVDPGAVYAAWAPFYDGPGNMMIDIEGPVVRSILDQLPVGDALDAACGTGRHSEHLATLGHVVTGVDSSEEMLAIARTKLPGTRFLRADLRDLPLDDASFDTIVCALALTHLPDIEPAFAEFARVLRPGGHLVISDGKGLVENIAAPMTTEVDGGWAHVPVYTRSASEYTQPAYRHGFTLVELQEPRRWEPLVRPDGGAPDDDEPPPEHDPNEPPNIWALHPFIPEATNAAFAGTASTYVWHFQLRSTS